MGPRRQPRTTVALAILSLLLPLGEALGKEDSQREKRDYVGKVPKLGGGGSDPNPLLDVYLPSYFGMPK